MGIAEDLIIIILTGLLTGLIANKLKIPTIIGFIAGGIIIGPYTGGITVSDIPRIELLAEIGVALLLFSIGLDFSFKELKTVKGISFAGTPIQILLLIVYGTVIGYILGFSLQVSIILGMIISLSSTMVVIKSLMNRGLVGTLSSRVMIGILIIQDLAAIPLMLIISKLNMITDSIFPMVLVIVKAFIILAAIILIGIKVIPWLLKFVVKLNSRELFLITVTALGLGIGFITHLFGLSLAFGAFVAGMVINESDYSHQALNDIIPLRDIFGLVFFTSIGMLLDLNFVFGNLTTVLFLVILVIAGKFVVFSLLGMSFKYYNIIPLAMGFGLSQIGEFSFVLARTGLKSNIITSDFYSLVLSVSVITMIISPFLSLLAVPVYSLKRRLFKHEQIQTLNIPQSGLNKHIVIAGGGRVGYQIASIYNKICIPFIIIEQDYRRFEKAKNDGFPVIYGDASKETVLSASKINSAHLIIITIPFIAAHREIVSIVSRYNPGIKIISRVDELSLTEELLSLNVYEVVQPEFEASIEIIRQSLILFDVPFPSIIQLTDSIRRKNYSDFKIKKIQETLFDNVKKTPFLLEMNWIEIRENSRLAGKSSRELAIRSETGVSVVGVLRESNFVPNPDADFQFQAGDLIAIIGFPEDKKLFDEMMN